MIFAEMEYESEYGDFHEELHTYLTENFSKIESGVQGDSWFWIFDGGEKVAIDTFTSMKHQVKSETPGPHVQRVLDVLSRKYGLKLYEEPECEAHEE